VAAMLKDYKGGEALAAGEAFDPAPANVEARTTRLAAGALKIALLPKATRGDRVNVSLSLHFGDEKAEIGIVTWGSTAGPVEDAVRLAASMGIAVQAIVPKILNPLPHEELKRFFARVKQVIVPELNFTGQLASLLRSTYRVPTISLTKIKGVPLEPSEIVDKIIEAQESLGARSEKRYGRAG